MTTPPRDEPFFIGWADMPPGLGRSCLRRALSLVALALVVAPLIALASRSPGSGHWDLDAERTWTGTLRVEPYALLELDHALTTALLVEQGKRGAWERAVALDGRAVTVRGAPIERGGRLMIELLPGDDGLAPTPLAGIARDLPRTDAVDLGPVVLRGEILDAKCHLGAMRPGDGKTHKACATLCIDGGIPPLLVTRRNGALDYALLIAPDAGPANTLVRPLIGEPVEVSGRLSRRGDLLALRLDDDGLRRLRPDD